MGIEKYHFSRNTSPREREFHARALLTRADRIRVRDAPRFTAETHPYSKDIRYVLDFVIQKLESWFGIPLNSKVPDLSDVLLFANKEFQQILENHELPPEETKAFCSASFGLIYLNCENKREDFFHHFIHELVHMMSKIRIMVRHERRGSFTVTARLEGHQSGLHTTKKDKFRVLNEVITEMLTCELLYALARKRFGYNFTDSNIAYWSEIAGLFSFFSKLSDKMGISFLELRIQLYIAYLNGDISSLGVVKDHYGTEALKHLANLSLSVNDMLEFLEKNKLDTSLYRCLEQRSTPCWGIFSALSRNESFLEQQDG